jgi:hypothetical protein
VNSDSARRRSLSTWYAAAVLLGTFGSWLAYGPLTSDAWLNWYDIRRPWAVDGLRLFVSAVIAMFILWALGTLDHHNGRRRERILAGRRVIVPPLIALATLAVTFLYLPLRFQSELAARHWPCPATFRAIVVPYFPYALYTFALWFGVITPPLMVIFDRVLGDFRRWRHYRSEFQSALDALTPGTATDALLLEAQIALQNYVVRLKGVGERSLPVILGVAAILVYEQTTPSQNTALHNTQSWGKVALWFLMGPAVISCIAIVTFGYQSAIRSAEGVYRRLLIDKRTPATVRASLLKAREELMWKGNGGSFIISILKSTSVLLVLIASGTAYVVKTVNGSKGWWAIFIPDPLFDFVRQIFS